jgi:hypothetical protein
LHPLLDREFTWALQKLPSHQHFHSYTGGFIKEFMEYYRKTFPHATVLPKMHFLESHLVEWL